MSYNENDTKTLEAAAAWDEDSSHALRIKLDDQARQDAR